ncbi:MAG: hypothetical protein R8N24_01335 [Alphaproteobacteria bacterium]|nr:hypothetical protein [Alphaproteobacteria bacterium]
MRKIFCAFLMMFISVFAHANIHIDGNVAKQVILSHIDTTYQSAALDVYNQQLESSGDYTISASGLYQVCIAAGWDIKMPDGKTKCDSFVKSLLDGGSYTYYEVCGPDKGKSGGTERCIDNVFYHWYTVADTQVTMLQADGLCKEYARIKFNDDIECSNKSRPGTVNPNNDYIKCTSKLTPTYYEFKFDDVVESKDINITASVGKAICEMHGVDYIYSQCSQHSTFSSEVKCYPAKCKTSDTNLCTKINESMKRFGYNTKIQNNECVISENTIISESQLRTAFGIDNLHFKTGYQLSAYSNMRSQLCEYISKNANTTITSCECNYNRTQLIRDGKTDDVLTCYANGQPIDFVFDDLSEHNKKIAQGNMEAFACSVLGGEYQGKTCFTPDKKLCDQISAATISECPDCAKAYFDEKVNACVLPNATKANNHQKKVNIGLIVGGAVVGAGIIIYTGGTGFAAVAVTIETIAAGMELGGQIHIDGVADEFFIKANRCDNVTCAEDVLQEYFQYISRMTNDLQSGEKLGIDSKMATLVEMLPNDSQFLIDTVAGCYEDNGDNFDISKCDDGVWNPDQIIRAIGIGLQFTSVFTSVGKWMLGAGRVQKIVNQTPNLTKALQKKIPGVKDAIQKSARQGKIIKTSNGKTVKALGQVDTEYMGKLKGWQVSYIDVVKAYNDEVQVYKFTENLSGKTYYLKHTDELEEITRTKRAYDILGNRSDIVHTVKVIEDDQQVLIDFATKHNLPSHKGNYWFITEEMPSSRTAFNLLEDGSDLGGKPITLAEQEEIINAVKRLNDGGIYHGDLGSNMFFSRDSSGKLRVDIIDYEPWSARDIPKQDLKDVNEMFEWLADVGLAEFRVGEKGVVAVKGEDGVIKILTQGSEDLMSSRHVSDIAHKYNKTIDLWTSNNLGYTYYRIYVNNNDNYAAIVADLQRSGYYVSSNKTNDGRYFIAISEQNIFGPWDNSASNWLKANKSVQSSTAGVNQLFLDKLKQYTGYNFIYKSAAESGLKRGHYRLDVSNMSDSEIYTIQNKLRYTGVADKAQIIRTKDKRTLLVLYEDDMINLGSDMKVSGSMLNNYYGSGAKVDNLQVKVENILNTSYPNEHALRQAWHNSGAWDMNEAYRLTQDLRAGVIRDIKSNPDLANRIRRYNSLSSAEKDQVWIDINYIVGGQNRVHTGKTMIGMVDNYDFAASGQKGFLGAHNGSNEIGHIFRYNRQNLNDFDRMFSTVVHENVHGFQESGRTAINENAWQYRSYNYSRGSTGGYTNQLIEMEARYIQEEASKNFMSELLRNL